MHIFGTMTHTFGTKMHIFGTMTHIFGTMTHIFCILYTLLEQFYNFKLFLAFLTLLTIFDCISYTYERVDCWLYAAFLYYFSYKNYPCTWTNEAWFSCTWRPGKIWSFANILGLLQDGGEDIMGTSGDYYTQRREHVKQVQLYLFVDSWLLQVCANNPAYQKDHWQAWNKSLHHDKLTGGSTVCQGPGALGLYSASGP